MKNKINICYYCSNSAKHVDREGVCTKCHKIDDESDEGNNGEMECVFCGIEICEDDCCYVEGRGNSCDSCASYCEDCRENHYFEDVTYCESCSEHFCDRKVLLCVECEMNTCENCIIKCDKCSEVICNDCEDKHKCKKETKLKSA